MDLLPTIAKLTETALPESKIDGLDISSTFTSDETPRDELIYYSSKGKMEGIRKGDWKYLEVTQRKGNKGKNEQKAVVQPETKFFLFNLADDIG